MTDPKEPKPPVPPEGGDPPQTPPKGAPEPVPYERFKEVNDNAKLLATQIADLQQQLKDKEEAGKTDLEKLQGQVADLTGKWETAQTKALRLEVAQRQGIPVELVDRLQGSTVEELTQDAERIKAYLKPAEGPGATPPPRGGNASVFSLENKSPDEIRKAYAEGKVSLTG